MEWISVNDQLPDNYTDVLIRNKSNFMHVVHFNSPKFLYKPNKGLTSVPAEGHRDVTHWMKLPKFNK